MVKFLRDPIIKNKYNLKPTDLNKAIIINREKISKPPFWRNDNINAWCITESTAKTMKDEEFGTYNDYWIGFYDEGIYKNKDIKYSVSAYGGMCSYNFEKFFDYTEIENEIDLEIQEKFLKMINWLLDEQIIKIQGVKNEDI